MTNVTFKDLSSLADELHMERELLESFAFACRLKNLSPSTMKCYAERLAYLVRYAASVDKELEDLNNRDLQFYIMQTIDSVSAATVNGRIRVFKVFYKHLSEEGLIDADPMRKIRLIRTEQRVKPVLSVEEMSRVLAQFNRKTFCGARDYCMILLTYDSMLRLTELLTLNLGGIDLHAKLVKVFGKGRKERCAPFSDKTAKAIHTYLTRFRRDVTGELLFPMSNGKQITARRGHRIFSNAGKKADLYVHPHLVRHSSASQFIRMGGSPAVLQKILGHSSLAITQRYVHLSNDDMHEAYERFSPASRL